VRELTITAVGTDRPGIVAGLTRALLDAGANLEDCRAAILRGSFAVIMAVAVPDEIDAATARRVLAPTATELGLELLIGDAPGPAAASPPGERCVISVYGADHPGIVHAVSRTLADQAVNIADLSSRVIGDPPVYVLGIVAELPPGLGVPALDVALQPVAAAERVDVQVSVEDPL
jgi:glycine cleavage system transcriptional repressor